MFCKRKKKAPAQRGRCAGNSLLSPSGGEAKRGFFPGYSKFESVINTIVENFFK
jgi:hypothetical protein